MDTTAGPCCLPYGGSSNEKEHFVLTSCVSHLGRKKFQRSVVLLRRNSRLYSTERCPSSRLLDFKFNKTILAIILVNEILNLRRRGLQTPICVISQITPLAFTQSTEILPKMVPYGHSARECPFLPVFEGLIELFGITRSRRVDIRCRSEPT